MERGVVRGLQHVALPFPGGASAVAAARRFYGETLGLTELEPPAALAGSVLWFAAGDAEIHLFVEPSGVAVNAQSRRHPCLRLDDLAPFRRRLAAEGVETIDSDADIPGRERFFAFDPFGNALEFLEISAPGE